MLLEPIPVCDDEQEGGLADRQTAFLLELQRRNAELERRLAERTEQLLGATAAQEALRASEEATRALVDNMLGGVITVCDGFIIESVNPAAARMFGYERHELVGKHLSFLVPLPLDPGEDPNVALARAKDMSVGKITEWEATRKNGEPFTYELSLTEYESSAGWRLVGNLRDLTELRQVERLKKEFVSTVSHELRTPLTSIRGSLGLISSGALGELPGEAREVVGIAERNCARLIGLINDILDLERLGAGKMELALADVPVAAILERAAEAVRGVAEQQQIRLEVGVTSAVVRGDLDRLVQVVVNLLSNAVKFSPPGASVCVAVAERYGTVEVRVTDRGRGIPAAHLPLVFEPFQQVETSDAREKGGTGLGLAICRSIVQLHGGAIGAESEPGRGSTFWFRVPAASGQVPAVPERSAERTPEQPDPGYVLLVEDDLSCLEVMTRLLAQESVPVETATSGRTALEIARRRPPALLVLDLGLPEMDGFEVVGALLSDPRLCETPLLVYTGLDLTEAERGRLTLGPTRFLTKSRATEATFKAEVVETFRRAGRKEVAR